MTNTPDSLDLMLEGVTLDNLAFQKRIGKGGMGEVWLAREVNLDIDVAVKFLHPKYASDQSFLIRFMREARAVARLDHPNIIRVMQAGRHDYGESVLRFMVMEYIDGLEATDLAARDFDGSFSAEKGAEIALYVAKALQYAHKRGVIHQDVKPANILVANKDQVKILDFGLATLRADKTQGVDLPQLESNPNLAQGVSGTPHYMSPEQIRAKAITPATDVYSLGISLFELLIGDLPFQGDSAFSVLTSHLRDELPLDSEGAKNLPASMVQLLRAMTLKKAEDRIGLVEVIEHLEAFLGVSPSSAIQPSSSWSRSEESEEQLFNLVIPPTSFVGREEAFEEFGQLFAKNASSFISILGPGGVGKTRFALEFANSQKHAFSSGVIFCDLTEARDADGIVRVVGRSLGIPLGGNPMSQVSAALRMSPSGLLLVIDNFEQVTKFAAETIGQWVREAKHLRVIVTSREPLGLQSERSFSLAPLAGGSDPDSSLPDLDALSFDETTKLPKKALSPAMELFQDRARLLRKDFEVNASNFEAIRSIVSEIDGIPLAIELAAARIASLTPEKILERLPRRFELLRSRRQDASQRQMTLRATIDWSWNLLSDVEQNALAQCSVFQDGFFLEAAEAVIDLSAFENPPFEIDVVEGLVQKSLLTSSTVPSLPGELRFRMLESIRQYAEEKLSVTLSQEASMALLNRHAEHFLEYGEEWSEQVLGLRGVEALDRIQLEFENFKAIEEGIGNTPGLTAVRSVLLSWQTMQTRGPSSAIDDRIEHALRLLGDLDPKKRVQLLIYRSTTSNAHGNRQTALKAGEQALQEASQLEDDKDSQRLVARARKVLATHHYSINEIEVGKRHIDKALAILETQKEGNTIGAALISKGGLLCEERRYDEAIDVFLRAIAIFEREGNRIGVATGLSNLGIVHQSMNKTQESIAFFADAEAIYRTLGDIGGIATALGPRASAEQTLGNHKEATRLRKHAISINRRLGRRHRFAIDAGNLGLHFLEQLDFEQARQFLNEAEEVSRAINADWPLSYWVSGKAQILLEREENLDEAHKLAVESLVYRRAYKPGGKETIEHFVAQALVSQTLLRLWKRDENSRFLKRAKRMAQRAKTCAEKLGLQADHNPNTQYQEKITCFSWIEQALATQA